MVGGFTPYVLFREKKSLFYYLGQKNLQLNSTNTLFTEVWNKGDGGRHFYHFLSFPSVDIRWDSSLSLVNWKKSDFSNHKLQLIYDEMTEILNGTVESLLWLLELNSFLSLVLVIGLKEIQLYL